MTHSRTEERTGFQEAAPWTPLTDLQTDFVMVYGLENLEERVSVWRARGYVVHLMTGISWGNYGDYLDGRFDGRTHRDEGQLRRDGVKFLHEVEDIPYMVPTLAFTAYLTEKLKAAVDAGVEAIHVEEPEFWVDAGYSPAFRREWLLYYGEEWVAPHSTADAQYRASKLKAYLYARCIGRVADDLKAYSLATRGKPLRFYVPTHSLLNYCQFRIVSPESKLLDLPSVDGYIAQVWTGTSRLPNVYQGVRKERTFETAYLEYGVMQELVRGTSRRMWFLHDPIEDDPTHDWSDYRDNYYRTLVASLLHPEVSRYEVCPWPTRIFDRELPGETGMSRIPGDYATVLLTVFDALGRLADHTAEPLDPAQDEPLTVGLLMSDTSHYQRLYPAEVKEGRVEESAGPVNGGVVPTANWTHQEFLDREGFGSPEFSAFYGLALPLLKQGALVKPVQLDNLRRFPGVLADYHVLVLSYEFQKPEAPDLHGALAVWVNEGGTLLYVGDGSDAFHQVRSWWNQGADYANPAQHLFRTLGLPLVPEVGTFPVGKGAVGVLPVHPFSLSRSVGGADRLRTALDQALAVSPSRRWVRSNHLGVRRGPYVALAVLDESDTAPVVLEGRYLNLLDASLPVLENPSFSPGEVAFLFDLSRVDDSKQPVFLAGARLDPRAEGGYLARGPKSIRASAAFLVDGKVVRQRWDSDPEGVKLELGS